VAHLQQYPVSLREQQIAMSAMAHAARRDVDAVTTLINIIEDPTENLRPAHVIVALLTEFRRGMGDADSEELALWFAGEAQALAASSALN